MAVFCDTGMMRTQNSEDLPHQISVSLWIYIINWNAVTNRIFGTDTNFEIHIDATSKKIKNELYDGSGDTSASALSLSTWYNIICTANKSTGAWKIYINGILDASGTGHTTAVTDPDYIGIGGRDGSTSDVAKSVLEDVRLYDGIISDAQANEIYNSGIINYLNSAPIPNLRASWFRYGRGDGTKINAGEIVYNEENASAYNLENYSGNCYYYSTRAKLRR